MKIIKTLVHTWQALCCYFTIINGILLFICFLMCVSFNNNNTHTNTHTQCNKKKLRAFKQINIIQKKIRYKQTNKYLFVNQITFKLFFVGEKKT